MSSENPLVQLVEDSRIFEPDVWNKDVVLVPGAVPPAQFLSSREVDGLLDRGLLRKPYFTVLREGIQPDPSRISGTRRIGDQVVHDFANPAGIRAELQRGATLKLNQLEDWHRPTRELIKTLESRIAAELKGYVFYTPKDNTGMLPHRDPAHVLAVQLEGAKRWRLFASAGQVDARGGLDVDASNPSHDFVMRPGDVLYLPHGYPHVATAQEGSSLHLTITLTEPAPLHLVEALVTLSTQAYPALFAGQGLTLEEKARDVADLLLKTLENTSDEELTSAAVQLMRQRTLA